jgi:hypothetical protein
VTRPDVCWRCEGTRCDTHAEECGDVLAADLSNQYRCSPCRACSVKTPNLLAEFVKGCAVDSVEGER